MCPVVPQVPGRRVIRVGLPGNSQTKEALLLASRAFFRRPGLACSVGGDSSRRFSRMSWRLLTLREIGDWSRLLRKPRSLVSTQSVGTRLLRRSRSGLCRPFRGGHFRKCECFAGIALSLCSASTYVASVSMQHFRARVPRYWARDAVSVFFLSFFRPASFCLRSPRPHVVGCSFPGQ